MLWRMRSRGRPLNAPAAFIHPCQQIVAKQPPSIRTKSHPQISCISPNPSTPIQTAVITATKTSTITDQIDDMTFPRTDRPTAMLPESGVAQTIPPQIHGRIVKRRSAAVFLLLGSGLIPTACCGVCVHAVGLLMRLLLSSTRASQSWPSSPHLGRAGRMS